MKGILFQPDMIQAIAEGRKTQTRRVIKPQPLDFELNAKVGAHEGVRIRINKGDRNPIYYTMDSFIKDNARYQIGETVYIKEAIHRFNIEYASFDSDFTPVMFLQSANRFHWRWKRDKLSPMFLPCEAARYFLTVTDVGAQRVQEITREDARAEGMRQEGYWAGDTWHTSVGDFHFLWDSINAQPKPVRVKGVITHYESYPWAEGYREETYRGKPHYIYGNPWEFTYSFKFNE